MMPKRVLLWPATVVAAIAAIALAATVAAAAPAALLVDHSGSVLTSPQVSAIYLGDHWAAGQGASDAFHTDSFLQTWLAGPSVTDVLAQYRVGGAGFTSSDKVSGASPVSFTDAEAQALVQQEIDTGRVVSGDQMVHVVYLPPGTLLTFQGVSSLTKLGGYHASYVDTGTGKLVRYAVVVYSQGTNGIDFNGNAQDNITIMTSRVLAGAFTNPDVGQGSVGWRDDVNGEVGDVAFTLSTSATFADVFTSQNGFEVVLLWSNKDEKLTAGAATTTSTGGTTAATASSPLALSPTTQTVAPGGTVTYTVSSASTVTEILTLAVSGLPANVTGTFASATVAPGGSTTLTITAAADAELGARTFTVTGTGDTTTEITTTTLTISTTTTATTDTATPAAVGFSMSVTPTAQEMVRGGEVVTYEIATEQVGEGHTRIRLKVLHLRRGLRAYLSRPSIGGGETVTVTILSHRDVRRGVHTFVLKGSSKRGDQRVTLTITVK